MKRILILIVLMFLAACGTADKQTSEGEKQVKTQSVSAEVPQERTVDLDGARPWEYASHKIIRDWLDKGETVYLFEDGAALEKTLVRYIDENNKDIADHIASYNVHLDFYVQQLKPEYPDKDEYFSVMQEAGDLAANGSYDEAKAKIEQAKQLRSQ